MIGDRYVENDAVGLVREKGGQALVLSERVHRRAVIRDVTRSEHRSCGQGYLGGQQPSDGWHKRSISGWADFGYGVSIIDADGIERAYRGLTRFQIGGTGMRVPNDAGMIGQIHAPRCSGDYCGELAFVVALEDAEFDWLWSCVGQFREPHIRVLIDFEALQERLHALNASGLFLLRQDTMTAAVRTIDFDIDEGDALIRHYPEEPVEELPKQTKTGLSVSGQLWWVIALLAAIVGLLVLRGVG